MKKIETNLKDCYILELDRFGDSRGYFESVPTLDLEELGFGKFSQVSRSKSSKGVVRGLHFQKDPYCQAKVVGCINGKVLDVVVDCRKDSPTYGQYTKVLLTPDNCRMLYVPRGFAHGFVALEDDTLFEYFNDNKYMPSYEGGILWNDPKLNIDWCGIFEEYGIDNPILSQKDQVRLPLDETEICFHRKPTRYLITGSYGQLGRALIDELRERGEHEYLAVDRDQMDITNRDAVMKVVKEYQPDVIIHCAAWTQVDKAEQEENKEKCRAINAEGTKNVADASVEVGAKLVYVSTDYVYDGTKDGVYVETDKVNPLSVYGRTKYEGEEAARSNPKHFITRTSWVFGDGNNFVKTMINLAKTHPELTVVDDQVGSPTYTVDLANKIIELANTEKYGTYHVNNEGFCSWHDLAEFAIKESGQDAVVHPVTTEEYYSGKTGYAYRPLNSRLSKDKLEQAGFARLPEWQDAVKRYIKKFGLKKGE